MNVSDEMRNKHSTQGAYYLMTPYINYNLFVILKLNLLIISSSAI